jgi:hypothetical protein
VFGIILRNRLLAFISLLVLAALACNAGATTAPTATPGQPAAGETALSPTKPPEDGVVQATAEGQTNQPAATPATPGTAVSSEPVSFQEGLASLNSFQLEIVTDSTGPNQFAQSSSQVTVLHAADSNANHLQSQTFTRGEEDPEGSEGMSQRFLIGYDSCNFADGEWSYEALTPLERELADFSLTLTDVRLPIENPLLVGSETINGVAADHYTFRLTSLGQASGAQVQAADGEYWLAQDGRYLVKYLLTINMRTGPEGDPATQAFHSTTRVELRDINQSIAITLPPECDALKAAAP